MSITGTPVLADAVDVAMAGNASGFADPSAFASLTRTGQAPAARLAAIMRVRLSAKALNRACGGQLLDRLMTTNCGRSRSQPSRNWPRRREVGGARELMPPLMHSTGGRQERSRSRSRLSSRSTTATNASSSRAAPAPQVWDEPTKRTRGSGRAAGKRASISDAR